MGWESGMSGPVLVVVGVPVVREDFSESMINDMLRS